MLAKTDIPNKRVEIGTFVGGEQLLDIQKARRWRDRKSDLSQARADDCEPCELETNGHRRTHHLGFDQCQADSADIFSFLSSRLSSPPYRRL
jgi:hypothetical protein